MAFFWFALGKLGSIVWLDVFTEEDDHTVGVSFKISSTNLYVWVVTSPINNITFWEKIKQSFERTISGNKFKSEITRKEW